MIVRVLIDRAASSSAARSSARKMRRRPRRLLLHHHNRLQLSLRPQMRTTSTQTSVMSFLPSSVDRDAVQQYFELRARTIQKLKETQSPNPYPHKFEVTQSITSFVAQYSKEGLITSGQKLDNVIVSLSGRVHNIRSSGNKLKFYDLHGEGSQVQILANVR
jgi:hypothetical protein